MSNTVESLALYTYVIKASKRSLLQGTPNLGDYVRAHYKKV